MTTQKYINIGKPKKESEKAMMFIANVELFDGEKKKVNVWIPKSQMKNGYAPEWLVRSKMQEIEAKFITVSRVHFLEPFGSWRVVVDMD
ncbi:hypothetical protein SC1000_08480 [Aggregatibacter actinomycetemcomitans]|nr:hypothetical protein SC1000_08480 [Aggregatibacter actinomycetemcomitans]